MLYQYGNAANPRAHYEGTGAEILQDLPEVSAFVAGLGTGGTLMGVGRKLKEANPKVKIIAVEPEPGDLVQGLRSLEEGFIPPILDLSLLDGKYLVKSTDALTATRQLLDKEGIFGGISSGAVLHGAVRLGGVPGAPVLPRGFSPERGPGADRGALPDRRGRHSLRHRHDTDQADRSKCWRALLARPRPGLRAGDAAAWAAGSIRTAVTQPPIDLPVLAMVRGGSGAPAVASARVLEQDGHVIYLGMPGAPGSSS
jgi:hypothetical protein